MGLCVGYELVYSPMRIQLSHPVRCVQDSTSVVLPSTIWHGETTKRGMACLITPLEDHSQHMWLHALPFVTGVHPQAFQLSFPL